MSDVTQLRASLPSDRAYGAGRGWRVVAVGGVLYTLTSAGSQVGPCGTWVGQTLCYPGRSDMLAGHGIGEALCRFRAAVPSHDVAGVHDFVSQGSQGDGRTRGKSPGSAEPRHSTAGLRFRSARLLAPRHCVVINAAPWSITNHPARVRRVLRNALGPMMFPAPAPIAQLVEQLTLNELGSCPLSSAESPSQSRNVRRFPHFWSHLVPPTSVAIRPGLAKAARIFAHTCSNRYRGIVARWLR